MKTVLEVKDLCKTYIVDKRQNNVLKNINFKVKEGDMTAIMGPSGSGKSTLLYTVSGMDNMTAGEVFFDGQKLSGMSEKEMARLRLDSMGFIFQQMYMLKNLTIMDNIILPAFQSEKNKGRKKEVVQEARRLMHKLDISEAALNDINEVSGGQLQRACICRSLINHPRMIFADEPTGALNRAASGEVMQELNRINREGTTILLVTHDMRVATRCDRVIYILDGNITGELELGKYQDTFDEAAKKDREKKLNFWLMEMGWYCVNCGRVWRLWGQTFW